MNDREKIEKLKEILLPGPVKKDGMLVSNDPYMNLDGALYDLEMQNTDPVCINTLKRILKQIGDARKVLKTYSGGKP